MLFSFNVLKQLGRGKFFIQLLVIIFIIKDFFYHLLVNMILFSPAKLFQ